MSKIILKVAVGLCLMTSFVYASYDRYKINNAKFEIDGQCDDFKVNSKSAGVTINLITSITRKPYQKFYFVGRGPTSDGVHGCSLFKSLMDCSSRMGTFIVGEDDGGGIFHGLPQVFEFQCK